MMSGLPMILLAAAQAAAPLPASAEAADEAAPAQSTSAADACSPSDPIAGEAQEIVICVERPEGFRIDPDVMEAERQARRKKLKRPERFADTSCQSVGPMGCMGGGGINLLAAALTAAEMAKRTASGENVGEMFVTEPQPDEYQFYREAKRKREAEKAAKWAESELVPAE